MGSSEDSVMTIKMPLTSLRLRAYLDHLKDPGTHAFLDNPALLAPCGHSMNKNMARRVVRCLRCNTEIEGIVPNPHLQLIVELVRRVHTSLFIQTLLNTTQEAAQIILENPPPPAIFPGRGQSFVYVKEWQAVQPTPQMTRRREMLLRSDHPDVPILKIHLRGYECGSLAVSMMCHPRYREEFRSYLKHFNLSSDADGKCTARTPETINWVLGFLLEYHQFPKSAKKILEQFKTTSKWHSLYS